jgi:hypothetical protein
MQHDDRMTYSEIAGQGTNFVEHSLQIQCKPFQAKPAIDALLHHGRARERFGPDHTLKH